jgi:hypothetical protein
MGRALGSRARSALDPARYASLALRELPKDRDEQIVSASLGAVGRAILRTCLLRAATRL